MNTFWDEFAKYAIANMDGLLAALSLFVLLLGLFVVVGLIARSESRKKIREQEFNLRERQMKLDETKASNVAKLVAKMDSLERRLSDARLSQEIINASERALVVATEVIEEEQRQR